jgi:hypothetical protein
VVEEHPVPAVGQQVSCISFDSRLVASDPPVEVGVRELDPPKAEEERRVRVAFDVGKGMMPTMHRRPLARAYPCRKPDHQAKNPRDVGPHPDRFVRHSAMEVHRGADDADLRGKEGDQHCNKDLRHQEKLAVSGWILSSPKASAPASSCSLAGMSSRWSRAS